MSFLLELLMLGVQLLGLTLLTHRLSCSLLQHRSRRLLDYLTAFGLVAATIIVIELQLIGYLGILSRWTLLATGLANLLLASALKQYCQQSTPFQFSSFVRKYRQWSQWERVALLIFMTYGVVAFVAALLTPELDYDSNVYRLTRIALWLQEGSIAHLETADPRINYTPFAGDLLQLWFTAPFQTGYPFVKLPQFLSGLYKAVAQAAFGRQFGFRRGTRLASALLAISMPALAGQMMTAQVDLMVAAAIFGGLHFLLLSLRARRNFRLLGLLAWFGIALAISIKTTVFYWGPGLLITGLFWLLHFRTSRKIILWQCTLASACLAIIAAPRYFENYNTFGNPFASTEDIARLHGGDDSALGRFSLERMTMNLKSYGIQIVQPNANPPGIAHLLHPLSEILILSEPDKSDKHSNLSRSRMVALAEVNILHTKNEFSLRAGCGVLCLTFALAGIVMALRRYNRKGGLAVAVLCLSTILFACIFAGYFIWSPYKFRYFLLILPAWILLSGFFLETLSGRLKPVTLWLLLVLSAASAGKVFIMNSNTGWTGLTGDQSQVLITYLKKSYLDLLREEVEPGARIVIVPHERWATSGFLRTGGDYKIQFRSREMHAAYPTPSELFDEMDVDYLICPYNTLAGHTLYTRHSMRLRGTHFPLNFALYRPYREDEGIIGYVSDLIQAVTVDKRHYVFEFSLQFHNRPDEIRTLINNNSNERIKGRIVVLGTGKGSTPVDLPAGATARLQLPVLSDNQKYIMLIENDPSLPDPRPFVFVDFAGVNPLL